MRVNQLSSVTSRTWFLYLTHLVNWYWVKILSKHNIENWSPLNSALYCKRHQSHSRYSINVWQLMPSHFTCFFESGIYCFCHQSINFWKNALNTSAFLMQHWWRLHYKTLNCIDFNFLYITFLFNVLLNTNYLQTHKTT